MGQKKLDYHQLLEPALALLRNTDSYIYIDEISETLIDSLDFPTSQLQQLLPSGRQTIFENQLQWALSYLEQDRLIESDGANAYRVTAIGHKYAQTGASHWFR